MQLSSLLRRIEKLEAQSTPSKGIKFIFHPDKKKAKKKSKQWEKKGYTVFQMSIHNNQETGAGDGEMEEEKTV